MALNRWGALFDPAWPHNQRPPPRLPTAAAMAPESPPRLHTLPEPAPTKPITLCGVPWADNIIASALRGEPVGFAALDMACSVAKVPRQAVRVAVRPAATLQTHPVG